MKKSRLSLCLILDTLAATGHSPCELSYQPVTEDDFSPQQITDAVVKALMDVGATDEISLERMKQVVLHAHMIAAGRNPANTWYYSNGVACRRSNQSDGYK